MKTLKELFEEHGSVWLAYRYGTEKTPVIRPLCISTKVEQKDSIFNNHEALLCEVHKSSIEYREKSDLVIAELSDTTDYELYQPKPKTVRKWQYYLINKNDCFITTRHMSDKEFERDYSVESLKYWEKLNYTEIEVPE